MKRLAAVSGLLLLSLSFAQEDLATIENPFIYPAEWSSAAPGEAQRGGEFRAYSISDFDSFNPFTVASSPDLPGDGMTNGDGSNGLIRRNPNNLQEWVPYMAESYEVSEDGTVYTFQIRQGMRFSDGEEITAEDWVTTYQIHTDPDVGSNSYSSFFIEDEQVLVESTGEYELTITFPQPDAGALSISAYTPWPAHVFGPVYEEGGAGAITEMWTLAEDPGNFVSPGPFVPASYAPGERATFTRSPYYGTWNVDSEGNQLPYLDGATVTLVSDLNAALAEYLSGNIDAFSPAVVDEIQQIQQATEAGQLDATLLPNQSGEASSLWITFNWNRADAPFKQEIFRDIRFRQAMSHLVDREAMVRLVYGGLAEPAYSGVYAVLEEWQNPNLTTFPYNPERAAELLAETGFSERDSEGFLINDEGRRLSFNLITNAGNNEREQAAQIFTDTAREAGVEVNFRPIAFEVLVNQLTAQSDERGFDAILLGLTGGDIDFPFGTNVVPCGTNLHAFNYAADGECIDTREIIAERLYYQGRRQLDVAERIQTGLEIQEVQSELQGFIQLVSPSYNASWNNRVGGHYTEETITSLLDDALFGPRDKALTFVR